MGAASRRKRLRNYLKLLPSRQEATTPAARRADETGKLSQRLIQIAQPYLNCGDDADEYRKELSLASTAWNLSLFPPDSREENMMKTLDQHVPGEQDREMIAQHFRDLMRRKEQLFPEDRRLIASVEVLNEGDSVRVLVASMT